MADKTRQNTEKQIGRIAALFLLISASASFGYALSNVVFNNSSNITGSVIGISSNSSSSLLLSTLALILIILLIKPSE